jgi:hypothetical protein
MIYIIYQYKIIDNINNNNTSNINNDYSSYYLVSETL